MNHLPVTLDARSLARLLSPLLHKTEATILRDISRNPKSLPPAEPECSGKKLWLMEKVIDWLPPGIGAALRRTLAREFEDQADKTLEANHPPKMRSIAEDLMAATAWGRES